ncbi:MAG: ATP synthase F0 subunit B [Desulfobacterales bacterium]|nr:ATP synthase F0 subunit B [Desulfobacterales bacterium]
MRNLIKFTVVFVSCFLLSTGFVFSSGGEGEHGVETAAPKGWIATDTYRVINFAVLFGALFFILRKPVAQALGDRIKGIEKQLIDLESKKKESEEKLIEYQKQLSTLEEEGKKIVSEYIKQGNEAKNRIIEEAKKLAEKLEEKAKFSIEQEFAIAKRNLQEEIFEKAILKAEELIKAKITIQDQEKLVDEYLNKVVA